MSYILDALKKSEQQHNHGEIPNVRTMHSSSLNYHNDKKTYWPYILIILVSLNLFAIVYFIFDQENPPVTNKVASTNPIQQQIENVSPSPITNKKIELVASQNTVYNESLNELQKTKVSEHIKDIEVEESIEVDKSINNKLITTEIQGKNIVSFYDLPESITKLLPTINVSSHVYSSNPQQRSIVINNKFLEEGDYVLDKLILIKITVDGAVFNFENTQFHYAVVSGWK